MPTMLTDHFSLEELDCKCGCVTPRAIADALVKTATFMEQVRSFLGNRPITVHSGYRCKAHNQKVGGEPNSFHLRGMACDFTVSGLSPKQVQESLERAGSPCLQNGLGRYARFTHVDRRAARARWSG